MNIGYILLALLGGMFLANACPHFIKGICGERFKTPFARGKRNASSKHPGTSSATVNIVWSFINLAISWALNAVALKNNDPQTPVGIAIVVGFFLFSLACSRLFKDGRGTGK